MASPPLVSMAAVRIDALDLLRRRGDLARPHRVGDDSNDADGHHGHHQPCAFLPGRHASDLTNLRYQGHRRHRKLRHRPTAHQTTRSSAAVEVRSCAHGGISNPLQGAIRMPMRSRENRRKLEFAVEMCIPATVWPSRDCIYCSEPLCIATTLPAARTRSSNRAAVAAGALNRFERMRGWLAFEPRPGDVIEPDDHAARPNRVGLLRSARRRR